MSKKFRNAFIQYTLLRNCIGHKPASTPLPLASRRRIPNVRRTPVVRYCPADNATQDTITESFLVECTSNTAKNNGTVIADEEKQIMESCLSNVAVNEVTNGTINGTTNGTAGEDGKGENIERMMEEDRKNERLVTWEVHETQAEQV